ncbi:MAG: sigma-70 family RNA polymerase sigma factor [Schleiferiaceae bacterium]|nr:sigma-70 family RNA polymerase sigma factor [Schleiferiaceae bacterium]
MSIVRISDAELVSKYVQGHEASLERLVLRHSDALLKRIYSKVQDPDVSQDIHQEAWIKFVQVIKKGEYKEEGKFAPFIHRVVNNLALDHLRKKKRSREISVERCGERVLGVPDERMNAEESALRKQWYLDVEQAVKRLPSDQQEVLYLRMYAGLSFKEIAEETGVGINTALGRNRYALGNLRKILGVGV